MGIETSCDDTAAAIVSQDRKILGQSINTQSELVSKFGGVYPLEAKREHEHFIDIVVEESLKQSNLDFNQLSGIAVTIGPGLELCLSVGARKAKILSKKYQLPLLPVNHLEGHALMARLYDPSISFPFLTLLVSGGHSLILLCSQPGSYKTLGCTVDDSVGEALDKTARLLGLDASRGGVELEALANKGDENKFVFPVPLRNTKNCDFSLSGLKTAAARTVDKLKKEGVNEFEADLAASFQKTVILHITDRIKRAINWCIENQIPTSSLVVSGGVASNQSLRASLSNITESFSWSLHVPPPKYCTDNGVMIAWAGIERWTSNVSGCVIDSDNVDIVDIKARWPLGENDKEENYYFPRTSKWNTQRK